MRDRIKKEMIEWYQKRKDESEQDIEKFVDLIIDKTTENLIIEIKNELENEFKLGNLTQPLSISDDYYLYLKFKDIKNKCFNIPSKDDIEINFKK